MDGSVGQNVDEIILNEFANVGVRVHFACEELKRTRDRLRIRAFDGRSIGQEGHQIALILAHESDRVSAVEDFKHAFERLIRLLQVRVAAALFHRRTSDRVEDRVGEDFAHLFFELV